MRLGTRRCFATGKTKKRLIVVLFLCAAAAFLVLTVFMLMSLRTSVTKMAKQRAKDIAIRTVNAAIAQKLSEENITYDSFVDFTYSADGLITAVNHNLAGVSKMSAELSLAVSDALRQITKDNLSVPLGSLSGVDILYGTGPEVNLDIKPYGSARAELKTDFRESGINQTVFEVRAKVSAEISVLMPTIRAAERINTEIPVISTVIAGAVPDSYTNVDRHGFEYEEDVLELAE